MEQLIEQQLRKHFKVIWTQLEYITENIPRHALDIVVDKKTIFYRMFHIVETLEYYTGDAEKMNWGSEIGINEDSMSDTEMINQMRIYSVERFQKYMEKIRKITTERIKSRTFSSENQFKWLDNDLDNFLYVLRHSNWHLGEIYVLLKTKGILINWR